MATPILEIQTHDKIYRDLYILGPVGRKVDSYFLEDGDRWEIALNPNKEQREAISRISRGDFALLINPDGSVHFKFRGQS